MHESSVMRRTTVHILAVLALALPVAWLAGEQHRENCIRANKTACSVLPWEAGKQQQAKTPNPLFPEENGANNNGWGVQP